VQDRLKQAQQQCQERKKSLVARIDQLNKETDTARRKTAEARKAAEAAEKDKSTFLAQMEVRTP
jgi:hypothetical protein